MNGQSIKMEGRKEGGEIEGRRSKRRKEDPREGGRAYIQMQMKTEMPEKPCLKSTAKKSQNILLN